jgi:DnaK suppressor protein
LSVIMTATQAVRGPASPAWRSLLEARWEERLSTLTELSLAYHDAAARSPSRGISGVRGSPGDTRHTSETSEPSENRELRRLMRETTVARRALRDTEEALGRLSAGGYGRCEQCRAPIPAATLLLEPEVRYCPECVAAASAA